MATDRNVGMIKVAYFLFRYSEPSGGRNYQLPEELRGFKSRKAVLEACHPKLSGGRTLQSFLGSVEGDIGGFRNWKAGNRPDHPHSGVLRRYLSPDARREVLWNEIRQYFPKDSVSLAPVFETSVPSASSNSPAIIRPASMPSDSLEADEIFEDEAEFDVQNLRKEVEVRQRQSVFRKKVLDNFGNECCLSGISEPCLLVAGHIVPWADRTDSRLNPRNGILLNVFFDKLFDRGLITFTNELTVIVIEWADQCSESLQDVLEAIAGQEATRPKKMPRPEFLAYHRDRVFLKTPDQGILM
ncbi:MAG: HNH endonuclease [Planctomycetaceae bacterium]